ncbi:hypothetical protein MFRU_010g00340 [Monilinia fructicola]|nr:hypothetical protein MFRU_010g00340 [Monilinia fructicola]
MKDGDNFGFYWLINLSSPEESLKTETLKSSLISQPVQIFPRSLETVEPRMTLVFMQPIQLYLPTSDKNELQYPDLER